MPLNVVVLSFLDVSFMNVFRGLKHIWEDPEYKICKFLLHFVKPEQIPDKLFLKYQYHFVFGERLNLKHPKTFNEKLQWLKLYDRKSLYSTLVDKYEVKKWVAERIGEQYVIPTLAVFDNVEQIDLSKLPDRFVLKCSHDSGSVVICKDKRVFDFDAAKVKLSQGMRNDFYIKNREWPYKHVRKRIIAEKYMEDSRTSELRDYKFFCMDGVCRAMFVATDRMSKDEPYFDFYDSEFNHLPMTQGHPNNPDVIEKPYSFETMRQLAMTLSEGIPHVRCDFYEVDGKPYFGEMTFYHYGGLVPFHPETVDKEWGEWIQLPPKRSQKN